MSTPGDLYSRYAHHYDHGRPEEFAALFTVDAVFTTVGREPVRGREAITEMARQGIRARPGIRHLVCSIAVEVAADGRTATGRAYVQAVQVDGTSLLPVTAGEYTDRFVLDDGRWLIADHRFQPFPG